MLVLTTLVQYPPKSKENIVILTIWCVLTMLALVACYRSFVFSVCYHNLSVNSLRQKLWVLVNIPDYFKVPFLRFEIP